MQNLKKVALLSLFAILGLNASAQDSKTDAHQITIIIPEVALLDIETDAARDFEADFPTTKEAGDKLTAAGKNSTLWLNYSSILGSQESRRIDVKAEKLVAGVDISVEATKSATGAGTLGEPTGTVLLTDTEQPIVTSIGSTYTNTGSKNGHQLIYSFATPDETYANLRADKTAVKITYTLADN